MYRFVQVILKQWGADFHGSTHMWSFFIRYAPQYHTILGGLNSQILNPGHREDYESYTLIFNCVPNPNTGHGSTVYGLPRWLSGEEPVWSLGQEDPLEGETAPHTILACKIPRTEEPARLQSTESQRAGHDWANTVHINTAFLSDRSNLGNVTSRWLRLLTIIFLCIFLYFQLILQQAHFYTTIRPPLL